MGLELLNGYDNIIKFTEFNSANSATTNFNSTSLAYDYLTENGYNVKPNLRVLDSGKTAGKLIEFQPDLTGGTQAGLDVANVTETAGGGVAVTTGAGTALGLSAVELLGGIIAGLGLGIVSYEVAPEFWINMSNAIFSNFDGYEPITYENIEDMSIMTLFKNGKTYASFDLVQAVNNYLINLGAFGGYDVTVDYPTTAGTYEINSSEPTKENIRATMYDLLKFYNYTAPQNIMAIEAFNKALDEISDSALEEATCYRIESSIVGNGKDYTTCFIWISLCNNEIPFTANVTSSRLHDTYANLGTSFTSSLRVSAISYGTYDNITSTAEIENNVPINAFAGHVSFDVNNKSLWSFNNNIVIIPNIPELPPLPLHTYSITPDSIPIELPDWWANMIEIGSLISTGGATFPLITTPFLPISIPEISPISSPVTTPQITIQTGNIPINNIYPINISPTPVIVNPIIGGDTIIIPPTPSPTPTPTPPIPPIPPVGGTANALFTVYNPTLSELNSLGSVLWSSNVIQQIIQMFQNNPMDAIISTHIIYVTPTTSSKRNIKLGYVDSGVQALEVSNQYVNLNCGTVNVPELYGDARDYDTTDVNVYLPMIGFRKLSTEDIIGSRVGIDYKVDVFTGTVLCNITVTKNNVTQVLYTFEGNCAVNLPLTGADKSRQLASVGSVIVGGALGGVGGAVMAGTHAISSGGAKASIQRSGNFSGNAGAMGCKKPYFVITSKIGYDAFNYNEQYGYPANITTTLGDCSGYTRVKSVHVDNIESATKEEKSEIETLLTTGVIIN